jgi:hypothetical protein
MSLRLEESPDSANNHKLDQCFGSRFGIDPNSMAQHIGIRIQQAKIILQNGKTVMQIQIRDTGSGGFLTPGYGIGKK